MRGPVLAVLVLAAGSAFAQPGHAQHAGHGEPAPNPAVARPECGGPRPQPSPDCARVVRPAFDPAGRLWLAWVQGGHVYVGRSEDRGRTVTAVRRITPEPAAIDANGENRAKVLADGRGNVYVTYVVEGTRPYTGDVKFSRSGDGGRTFTPPRSLSDERTPSSLRFDDMGIGRDGRLYVAWIDKRDRFAAEADGRPYTGAALYYAVSDDGGATFGPNRRLHHGTCECCRTAMAIDDGLPAIAWRNIFGSNVRDHAFLRFVGPDRPGAIVRISEDRWGIDACPHHGPGLAVGRPDTYHVVWYTEGAAREGAFYARSDDGGQSFTTPLPLGDPATAPSHAHVAAIGDLVVVAWKGFDGEQSVIRAMVSRDGGRDWSTPLQVASSRSASDHPLLVADGTWIHLSWQAAAEGYRLLRVARR